MLASGSRFYGTSYFGRPDRTAWLPAPEGIGADCAIVNPQRYIGTIVLSFWLLRADRAARAFRVRRRPSCDSLIRYTHFFRSFPAKSALWGNAAQMLRTGSPRSASRCWYVISQSSGGPSA